MFYICVTSEEDVRIETFCDLMKWLLCFQAINLAVQHRVNYHDTLVSCFTKVTVIVLCDIMLISLSWKSLRYVGKPFSEHKMLQYTTVLQVVGRLNKLARCYLHTYLLQLLDSTCRVCVEGGGGGGGGRWEDWSNMFNAMVYPGFGNSVIGMGLQLVKDDEGHRESTGSHTDDLVFQVLDGSMQQRCKQKQLVCRRECSCKMTTISLRNILRKLQWQTMGYKLQVESKSIRSWAQNEARSKMADMR